MGQPDREAEPNFSQPIRQIVSMLIVLGLVGAGAYVALPRIASVFLANPYLNGFIAFVFVIGVVSCFWQMLQLVASVNWIVAFTGGRAGREGVRVPRLLAPLAALLRSRGAKSQIAASSTRSILDSVATRIDEARDITRYITNLLIFLGLLGTFYGLATTVPAVVDTIRSLAPQGDESSMAVFNRLMSGLETQLGGMGVAFASSLLGLAGSLVVGLLELFAGHGQNRFYRELEEWLSSITRLGYAADGDHGGEGSATLALVDHMAEQMETLQTLFSQADRSRAIVDERMVRLADSVERLTETLAGERNTDSTLARVADGQERLIAAIEASSATGGGVDPESRMRLRSIDVQLLRILEEMSAGRQESTSELRGDLAELVRALREVDTPDPGPADLADPTAQAPAGGRRRRRG